MKSFSCSEENPVRCKSEIVKLVKVSSFQFGAKFPFVITKNSYIIPGRKERNYHEQRRPEGVFFCAFQGTWADLVRTARNNNMNTYIRAKNSNTLSFELTGFPSNALLLKRFYVATQILHFGSTFQKENVSHSLSSCV